MRRLIHTALLMLVASSLASAQKLSLSTNLVDYACLGTLNAEVSYTVGQHWSLAAGAKYNPFIFYPNDADRQFQYRQRSFALGVRYWPWHSFSGWWVSGKVRYQEYNWGGVFSREAEEGDKTGLGLYAGYTYMISKHFNVEFGLGAWGGRAWYRKYSCPVCGLTVEDGRKWFLLPDDLMISFAYVF